MVKMFVRFKVKSPQTGIHHNSSNIDLGFGQNYHFCSTVKVQTFTWDFLLLIMLIKQNC